MQEVWLPSNTPQSKAVGRFEDFTKSFTDKDGSKKSVTKLVLYTMVPGVAEQSCQTVLDDAEGDRIKANYSQAYDLYCKNKTAPEPEPVPTATQYGVKGIPIEDATFLGKDQLARLKLMGFLTIEQLADMSDIQCQNVGFGAKDWRRKANEQLIVARDAVTQSRIAPPPTAPQPAVDQSAVITDLTNKVEALMAHLARAQEREMELLKANAELAAPKRKGRPPKAAEAQPEA